MDTRLIKLFEGASKIKDERLHVLKCQDGLKRFRRKVFGLLKLLDLSDSSRYKPIIRTEDKMARIFYKMGMASSLEGGREIAQKLCDNKLYYDGLNYIRLESVADCRGNIGYKILDETDESASGIPFLGSGF